jgi:hypothetical protein
LFFFAVCCCLLLAAAFTAQAQLAQLIGTGINVGRLAAKYGEGAEDRTNQLYVSQANYHGEVFAQKRTPASKLPGKGGPQIAALEHLLAGRSAALQADATSLLLTPAWEIEYAAALQAVNTARPSWSVVAYENEAEFYRLQNERRARAQKRVEARAASRRDSLNRLAPRLAAPADSVRK